MQVVTCSSHSHIHMRAKWVPALPCLPPVACRLQFEGSNDKQYIVVRDSEIMAALA
jgi:hypothetical protein